MVKSGTFLQVKKVTIRDTQNLQFKMPRVMRKPELLTVLFDNMLFEEETKL